MQKTSKSLLTWFALSLLFISCKHNDNTPALTTENDLNTYSLTHDGIKRTLVLYVPKTYDGTKPVPLVVALHGSGGTGKGFQYTGFNQKAEEYNFIVVYPDAYDHQWNIGNQYDTQSPKLDDVGFISLLITTISNQYKIDQSRVYATGHSRGGFMSYHLACEIPDKIAAIAPVAGLNLTFTQPTSSKPIPIAHLHAKDDPIVLYNGEPYVYSVDDLLSVWRSINKCSSAPEEIFNKNGIVGKLWNAPDTKADIVLYSYENGGHAWLPFATDFICDFFYNHPKRENNIRIVSPLLSEIMDPSLPIEIKAEANDVGSIEKIEFYANSTKLGEDTSAPFSFTWTNATIGNYTIQLKAYLKDGEKILSANSVDIWVLPVNIALNRPASSSSNENTTLTPNFANDGNIFSRWASTRSDPQWISIELGALFKVNGATLVWESASGKTYQIQTSLDNQTWETLYSTTSGVGGTEYIPFQQPTDARYVRMYGTERTTVYGYSLWEFQVHGEKISD